MLASKKNVLLQADGIQYTFKCQFNASEVDGACTSCICEVVLRLQNADRLSLRPSWYRNHGCPWVTVLQSPANSDPGVFADALVDPAAAHCGTLIAHSLEIWKYKCAAGLTCFSNVSGTHGNLNLIIVLWLISQRTWLGYMPIYGSSKYKGNGHVVSLWGSGLLRIIFWTRRSLTSSSPSFWV